VQGNRENVVSLSFSGTLRAQTERFLSESEMEVAFQPSSAHPSGGARSRINDECTLLTTNQQLSEFEDIIQRMDRILNEPVVTTAASYSGYSNTYMSSENMTNRSTHLVVGNGCVSHHQHCRSAPATATVAVDLLHPTPDTRPSWPNSPVAGKEIPATVRVNIGIDEDLKMILDMDPSIIEVVATDDHRQQQQAPPQASPLPPLATPPPDKVLGLPPRAGGYGLVMCGVPVATQI
jgi:hypothetical protein